MWFKKSTVFENGEKGIFGITIMADDTQIQGAVRGSLSPWVGLS